MRNLELSAPALGTGATIVISPLERMRDKFQNHIMPSKGRGPEDKAYDAQATQRLRCRPELPAAGPRLIRDHWTTADHPASERRLCP